ncbi:MAG: DUF1320 domain-containing protein [Pseudomonadota bacterium]
MAYCTQSDMLEQISQDEVIQLTDDAGSGAIDADVVTRAIADADGEIDAYCGKRYAVPFSTVPAIIRKLSVDMAIYNLFARREGAPDDRSKRYDSAIRLLRDVGKGAVSLGADDPDGTPPETNAPQMSTENPARIFSRSKMTGF